MSINIHIPIEQVLQGPVMTEKSLKMGEQGKQVVYTHPQASKEQIQAAVEKFYGVQVSVHVTKNPEKYRARGRYGLTRKRLPRKKAILTPKGDKLFDLMAPLGSPSSS